MQNRSRFASFRFEAKKFFLRNRRTLQSCPEGIENIVNVARVCLITLDYLQEGCHNNLNTPEELSK